MENRLFEGRNVQRQQQSHPLPMSFGRPASVLTQLKQASPEATLQRRMMQQARNQSGSL